MDDIGGAIQSFLAQPGAMEQVEAMAKQLGLGGPPAQQETEALSASPELPGLPEGISPELLQTLIQAVSQGSQPDDRAALLAALRPLLGQTRQEKLDKAVRALNLTRTARLLGNTIEL